MFKKNCSSLLAIVDNLMQIRTIKSVCLVFGEVKKKVYYLYTSKHFDNFK